MKTWEFVRLNDTNAQKIYTHKHTLPQNNYTQKIHRTHTHEDTYTNTEKEPQVTQVHYLHQNYQAHLFILFSFARSDLNLYSSYSIFVIFFRSLFFRR